MVVRAADGTPLITLGRCIGRATNNVAEYTALITAMREAVKLGARKAVIRGDSELIIKQMRGEYRVKHPDMKQFYEQAQDLLREFEQVKLEHNLRHKNELADKLLNLALDRKCDVTDVDEQASGIDLPSPTAPKAGDRFVCGRCACAIEVKKASSLRPHQLKAFTRQCGQKHRRENGNDRDDDQQFDQSETIRPICIYFH